MHAGGSTVTLVVRCEQEPCTRRGRVFNEIVVPLGDVELMWEGYGHGAEDVADYCPACGVLGVLSDVLLSSDVPAPEGSSGGGVR
jgi:hypothetical protein